MKTFRKILTVTLVPLLYACGGSEAPEISPEQLEQLRSRSEAFQGMGTEQMLADNAAMTLAAELADAYCASCHGTEDGQPDRGVPAFMAVFDYGDSAQAIRTTITEGRHSLMPPLGNVLGEVDIGALVAHVRGFSSGEDAGTFARTADQLYNQHCVVCHGPEGKGNPELGAPDLTDDYWQYGDAMMVVRLNITGGIDTRHPALGQELTETEIDLLTAHVLNIRQ